MGGGLATVSVEGILPLRELHVALHFLALVIFLFGAVRMQQARQAGHWVCLGWGFGLMLAGFVNLQAQMYGLYVLAYYPGGAERDYFGYDSHIPAWWESWAWWGGWAVGLCGKGLVAVGFFGAAREVVREALFGRGPGRRKGAKA